ncbi:hypothetical protein GS501_04775 [Saccharibacter sp. 17.LH.SD]|uniref:carbohydrate porin n=1 Tax=Saccharibacter sp. 17.LH.SD TaxID=2689393 RepID=UPI00136E3E75|nr:carbohydrate porin [Saccharibacter sp. 17.LH.SD]MXV44360.1 hypothetical protein [Saccharibacter sp. 17.LH.SD]
MILLRLAIFFAVIIGLSSIDIASYASDRPYSSHNSLTHNENDASISAQADDAMADTYDRWLERHQKIRIHERKSHSQIVSKSAYRDYLEQQKQIQRADEQMAAVYATWPILKQPSSIRPGTQYDDALLGSWWGLKPFLADHGVVLSVNYLGMIVGNVSGGMRHGEDYAGQISAGLDIDWGVLAGLKGFSTHIFLLNRTGRPVGRDYVGDSVFNENEIYGAGGDVIAHLGYAFVEQKLFHNHLDLMAGRMGSAMLFNSSPIYCDFLSFGFCPAPRAITGGSQGAFVMPPQNNWSFYANVTLPHNIYVRTGINAAGGLLGGRSGFNWSSHGVTGVMFPFELGWTPQWGKDNKPIHLRAGFYGSTSQASDVALNQHGHLMALEGGPALNHRGFFAAWAGGDIMLIRQTQAPNGGLVFFFNYDHSDNKISIYQDMGLVGFEDRGFWKSRPLDRIGVLFIWSKQSTWLSQRIRMAGLPGAQSHTGILEAQYGAHIAPGTILTPDIQYVIRPGATRTYHNAIVLGTSLQVGF